MKIKHILSGFLTMSLFLSACVAEDDVFVTDRTGITQLRIFGRLLSDISEGYPSIIDDETGIVTVQVPYYLSDSEPIMGDLTQMKLEAQVPTGCSFSPSLAGVFDLTAGYRTNFVDDRGHKTPYTIYAEAVKSKSCSLLSVSLTELENAPIVVRAPEEEGDHGTVNIYKTSSSIDGALHSAVITTSPWSTVECKGYDPETGILDLSDQPQIIVTAQDGVTKAIYDVVVDYPEMVDYGVGFVANLFGYQLTLEDPHGMEPKANTTMAVVDDYLVVSNCLDVTKMPVFNRFTGEHLENIHVNVTGLPTDRQFRAICGDDAGHLIAVPWVNTNAGYGPIATQVEIYVWENGIESAPKRIFSEDINGKFFENAPMGIGTKNFDMFNTVTCKGNILSSYAALGTSSKSLIRTIILPFNNGETYTNTAFVEWAGQGAGFTSMWDSTKCSLLTTKAPWGYIWDQGMSRMGIYYVPAGTGIRTLYFEQPASHWWISPDPATPHYSYVTRSNAYMEFNGACLLATTNGMNQGSGHWVFRLYVADITHNPNGKSLTTGFVFDSREGNKKGTVGVPGTGPYPTGYTSSLPFDTGTVFGKNDRQMCDVVFGRSADGNAVQVYMLVHDAGLIAYEMTRYDI